MAVAQVWTSGIATNQVNAGGNLVPDDRRQAGECRDDRILRTIAIWRQRCSGAQPIHGASIQARDLAVLGDYDVFVILDGEFDRTCRCRPRKSWPYSIGKNRDRRIDMVRCELPNWTAPE